MKKKTRSRQTQEARGPASEEAEPRAALPPLPAVPTWAIATLAFVLALAANLLGLAPTVGGGDSGELIVVATALGGAHPPGYPLYTLLAHAFSWLPFATPALAINAFSAFCGAGTAALLVLLILELGVTWPTALASALLFTFSPLAWEYNTAAEVFPLNNVFAVTALYVWTKWQKTADAAVKDRYPVLGALLFGLAMSHHHTFVFLGVPVVALIFYEDPRWLTEPKRLGWLAAAGLIGLTPYLYLLTDTVAAQPVSWGDTSTLRGVWHHILRRDFGTFTLSKGHVNAANSALARASFFASLWAKQQAHVGIPLVLVGVFAAWRTRNKAALGVAAAAGVYIIAFTMIASFDLTLGVSRVVFARFWLLPLAVSTVLVAVGLDFLCSRVRPLLLLAPVLALAAIPLGWQTVAKQQDSIHEDFARAMIGFVPAGAIVLTEGDHFFGSTHYVHDLLRERPDVTIFDKYFLTYDWSPAWAARHLQAVTVPAPGRYGKQGFNLAQFVDANIGKHHIYIVGEPPDWDVSLKGKYDLRAAGLLSEIRTVEAPVLDDERLTMNLLAFKALDWRRLALPDGFEETWTFALRHQYLQQQIRFSTSAFESGFKTDEPTARKVRLEAGIAAVETARTVLDQLAPFVYKNLGIALQEMMKTDPAKREPMKQAFRRYLASGPAKSDETALIQQLIDGTTP